MKNIMKIALALMALSFFVFSCENNVTPASGQYAIEVSITGIPVADAQSKALFSDGAVDAINIEVYDSVPALVASGSLTKGASSWTGTITNVPSGTMTFNMEAVDADSIVLYDGTDSLAVSGNTSLEITAVRRAITFYFKVPTWVNGAVTLDTNGNGTSWGTVAMTACAAAQWYKRTVTVTDVTLPITYQPRMTETGVVKYMHAPDPTAYNSADASITASTGYAVIDATGALFWSGDNFSIDSDSGTPITTPASDPGY